MQVQLDNSSLIWSVAITTSPQVRRGPRKTVDPAVLCIQTLAGLGVFVIALLGGGKALYKPCGPLEAVQAGGRFRCQHQVGTPPSGLLAEIKNLAGRVCLHQGGEPGAGQ